MSVFQLQEWWGVKLSEEEEFDHGGMVIGNIDNAEPPSEKIAVGSLQGILRIYSPSHPQFKVEDLILEEVLNAPILQLLLGKFIPGSNLLGLAVLHPKCLVVYELIPQSNKDGRVNFYSLRKCYSHDLGIDGKHFTAYNMNSGCFGDVKDREMIIVQSLDGKIQIFEQSATAITRQISNCLIPGPIIYIPKIDSFVTINHACEVECYRYQVLVSLQNEIKLKETESKNAGNINSIRSTMKEWSLHIGEPCRQILEGHFSTSTSTSGGNSPNPDYVSKNNNKMKNKELLILCDKNIFLVKSESGGLIQQKRLERSDASCMCMIPASLGGSSSGGSSSNFIVAGQDATLQVYAGFNLVWAAKVPSVPVQVAVGSFGNQKGLIVCLDDEGRLSVNYLGTKPPMSAVMKQVRELDYDLVESEHRALLQIIRDSQNENKIEATDKLYIRPQLPKLIETENPVGLQLPYTNLVSVFPNLSTNLSIDNQSNSPYIKILIRLYLSYSADKPATQVSVSIEAPDFIHIVPKNIILSTVSGVKTTPQMVKVYLYALKDKLPTNLDAVVTASYTSHLGEPRVTSIPLALPLFLACRPKPPVKSAQCKIVLDTDTHPAQPLTELFGDMLYAYQSAGMEVAEVLGSGAAQAMGFQLFTALTDTVGLGMATSSSTGYTGTSSQPAVVSILVSKNAGRYRIQADSYSAIAVVLEELERRLHCRLTNTTTLPTTDTISLVKCTDPLPLEQYFNTITAHFQTRQRIALLSAQLNDAAHQYRMVEKRLLVRYKDRNPTPLSGLDSLMKETYDRLIALSDQMEEQQNILQRCFIEVDGHSRCIVVMAALKYGLTYGERQQLRAYLCPDLKEGTEQGWEETVNASVTFLLKTALAKTAKDNSSSLSGTTLELPSSIDTLQKHLLLLFDRLDKGGRLTIPATTTPTTTATATTPTAAQSRSSKNFNSRVDAK